MAKKKAAKSQESTWVALTYNIPDNIITRFATNMTVQIIENEFKVSFFEQFHPIRLSADAPPPKEIQAKCVGSVIITADRLPKFIKALQDQLNKYNTRNKPNK